MTAAAAVRTRELIAPNQLESLYREHCAAVIRAAYRVTGNVADAEDVLQTVFLRLTRREEDEAFLKNAGAYLHRAAVNCAIDMLRSRQSARSTPIDDVAGVLAADSSQSPDRAHRSVEIRAWVRRAIASLSPKTAEIFTLRYLDGFGNSEIAEMLDTSPTTVAVTLNRAREKMTKDFKQFMGESHA